MNIYLQFISWRLLNHLISFNTFSEPTPVLAIVLGVLGGVLLVVIAAIIFIVYRRRNKQRHLVT